MSENVYRLRTARLSNEFAGALDPDAKERMTEAAAQKLAELFEVLQIDCENDHNMRETPQRVARMLIDDLMYGRYNPPPSVTEFENTERYDQLLVTGPIEVRSTCAHHLMPIVGKAFIGILPSPDGKIIGLSKYDRIVHYFSARLQIQEELVAQIGRFIMETTKPRGLAIRMSAIHMCRTHRGVRASLDSRMVSSSFYGDFLKDANLKSDFLQECLRLEQGV